MKGSAPGSSVATAVLLSSAMVSVVLWKRSDQPCASVVLARAETTAAERVHKMQRRKSIFCDATSGGLVQFAARLRVRRECKAVAAKFCVTLPTSVTMKVFVQVAFLVASLAAVGLTQAHAAPLITEITLNGANATGSVSFEGTPFQAYFVPQQGGRVTIAPYITGDMDDRSISVRACPR